ncbi:MAG: DUF1990 family protein [Pleurocapsa sp. SU_196_0]|nr:DUF1990 family protein [Pleurocapsa sp. SU_196_0]
MNVEEVRKDTARPGWFSRLQGFFAQLRHPTKERLTPLPDPPVIPTNLMSDDVQLEGDGFGKLLGRRYEVSFSSTLEPEALMRRVKQNVSALSPEELAAFEKTSGSPWVLRLGDEFDITIWGPWNGRVRVIEVTEDAFSFVTLRGHPEAGIIRFAASRLHSGALRFHITSWARSRERDGGFDVVTSSGLAKSLQA